MGDGTLPNPRVASEDLLGDLCRVCSRPVSKFTITLGLGFLFKCCAVSFQDAEQSKRLASSEADVRRVHLCYADRDIINPRQVHGLRETLALLLCFFFVYTIGVEFLTFTHELTSVLVEHSYAVSSAASCSNVYRVSVCSCSTRLCKARSICARRVRS